MSQRNLQIHILNVFCNKKGQKLIEGIDSYTDKRLVVGFCYIFVQFNLNISLC